MIREEFQVTRDALVKRPPRVAEVRDGEVHTVRVDPRVWAMALDLAGGDARRLEVHSTHEVVVRNRRIR